jgi:CDGSH-type Zn-finger protein/uncharacterized Fe-S cluster protein YjdI
MSDTPRRYGGQGIEVTYDARRCIHAAECVRRLPAVFDTARRPWIRADLASADAIAAVVARCPSGALHVARHDGGAEEVPPEPTVVRAVPDGPLHVHGRVRLLRPDGSVIVEDLRLALCRCGQSQNKPFCDNSHRAAGFVASGEVPTGGEPEPAAEPLTITALADGPLLLRGAFTLYGTGENTYSGSRAAFCRCGGSGTKPLCDGTHRRNGFRDRETSNDER